MFLGEAMVAVMPSAQIQQYPWGSIAASFVGSDSLCVSVSIVSLYVSLGGFQNILDLFLLINFQD